MRNSSDGARRALSVMALLLLGAPAIAVAQAPTPRRAWTFEFYAGAALVPATSSGSAFAGFGTGTPFTTQSGRPSRVVPSWYFGDGAALLNDVMGQFSTLAGTTLRRITPLDSALVSAAASHGRQAAFGARLHRQLTARAGIEFGFERSPDAAELTGAMQDALAASRDSFKLVFQDLLATAPVTNVTVTSTLAIPERSSSRNQLTAALTWQVMQRQRLSAQLIVGAGLAMHSGDALEATLTGSYTFRLLNAFTMTETDRAVVSVSEPRRAAMGLVGAGVAWELSPRVSLRADVRVALSSAGESTVVSGTPVSSAQSPTSVLPSTTTPSIQFSTTTGVPSSLGGTSTSVTTFSGSGLNRRVAFTLGIVRRF